MKQYIQIQTTSICNARCKICPYVGSLLSKNKAVMSDAVFSRLISAIAEASWVTPKLALYMQNEPLTDPALASRIKQLAQKVHFGYLELSTNCSLLSAERAASIIEASTGVSLRVELSFQGNNQKSFEEMTGLNYQTCLANLKNFLTMVESHSNIACRVVACTSIDPEIAAHIKGLNKKPGTKIFSPNNRAGNLGKAAAANTQRPCTRWKNWIHFNWLGDVILCCNDYNNTEKFGNIMDFSLQELYDKRNAELPLRLQSPDCICHVCDRKLV